MAASAAGKRGLEPRREAAISTQSDQHRRLPDRIVAEDDTEIVMALKARLRTMPACTPCARRRLLRVPLVRVSVPVALAAAAALKCNSTEAATPSRSTPA